MNTIVRQLLTAIQEMNDGQRQPMELQPDPAPGGRMQRLALDFIVHQRLASSAGGGFTITPDGRAWLQNND